ncbi:MAG: tRNA (adenosine(37)-N6)-threonylcarbamoyltransferase complex dimerization subunit type 1 TsaB [Lacipirellulaceae bacterium]
MKILALETSGKSGSVALLEGQQPETKLIGEIELPSETRSAQSLVPTLDHLLKQNDWQTSELELICVCTGPGSFTGLRVGVTTAKTLAYALGVPLVEVNTLAALAVGVSVEFERLWCVLDAQRQELFTCCFNVNDSLTQQTQQNGELLSVETFLAKLEAGDFVHGPAVEKLSERLPSDVRIMEANGNQPRAADVGTLGYQRFLRGETVDALQLVPKYGRRSAAEEKAEA